MLSNDILIVIFNLLDLKSQINMISTTHYLKNNILVTDLYHQDNIILKKLTTKILKQKIFMGVTKLNASDNKLITGMFFMKKLKKLCVKEKCGIDQNCINGLNLIELDAYNNNKIINVSFMSSLQKLQAGGTCGIDQNGVRGLNLIKLNTFDNIKIKDVSFMTNLQILDAGGDCGIDQNGLNGLNLIGLGALYNKKIKNVEKKCLHFF